MTSLTHYFFCILLYEIWNILIYYMTYIDTDAWFVKMPSRDQRHKDEKRYVSQHDVKYVIPRNITPLYPEVWRHYAIDRSWNKVWSQILRSSKWLLQRVDSLRWVRKNWTKLLTKKMPVQLKSHQYSWECAEGLQWIQRIFNFRNNYSNWTE